MCIELLRLFFLGFELPTVQCPFELELVTWEHQGRVRYLTGNPRDDEQRTKSENRTLF